MMAPGWKKQYHVGVRASESRKLVAFISAVPVRLRVRDKTVMCSEVNFLCIHKKLRGKRLAPVLIKEVTRISNLDGIWQGLYTAGIVLPKPVSTCRYFHRSINWQKLNDCGFSPLPAGSKPAYQIRKYALPENTSTKGLRAMTEKDLDGVVSLLKRYLDRFDMAPEFTKEEAHHWFLPKPKTEQVIWSYVVEVGHSRRNLPFPGHADCAPRTTTRRSPTSSPSSALSLRLSTTRSTRSCASPISSTTPPRRASRSHSTSPSSRRASTASSTTPSFWPSGTTLTSSTP